MCDKNSLIERLYRAYSECNLLLTDSREVAPAVNRGKRVIFFALKGERFDANDFIEKVIEDGAAYVVTSRRDIADNDHIFRVDDTLVALQQLANFHRRLLKAKIIVITGSNGKTTTKELLSAILLKKYRVTYTKGNLNNHIGVPLTLLSISKDDDFAVVEHGANHQGEIALLCSISEPDFGIITNIGRAHLEGFGGEMGVVKAKGELYDNLASRGKIAFYNSSIEILKDMVEERADLKAVPYSSDCIATLDSNSEQQGLTFMFECKKVESRLYGDYNILNLAAAIAIGSYFGVDSGSIVDAIESYTPQNMRSQLVVSKRNSIIVDAYNANPSSMMIAIENFEKDQSTISKLYILGQMNELGSYSSREHQIIAEKLHSKNAKAILIGLEFKESAAEFNFEWYQSVEEAISSEIVSGVAGHSILLKGSRSVGVEKLLQYL